MNREIRDRQNFLYGAARGCGVYKAADITSNMSGIVSFDTEVFDTDSMWAVSPNPTRITIPSTYSGRVNFYGCIAFGSSSSLGSLRLILWRNGGLVLNRVVLRKLNGQGTALSTDAAFCWTHTDEAV